MSFDSAHFELRGKIQNLIERLLLPYERMDGQKVDEALVVALRDKGRELTETTITDWVAGQTLRSCEAVFAEPDSFRQIPGKFIYVCIIRPTPGCAVPGLPTVHLAVMADGTIRTLGETVA